MEGESFIFFFFSASVGIMQKDVGTLILPLRWQASYESLDKWVGARPESETFLFLVSHPESPLLVGDYIASAGTRIRISTSG